MTRHERFYMVLLIIVLIGTQIMGVIGYNLGVYGRVVTYTGWAGYFIMVGFFSHFYVRRHPRSSLPNSPSMDQERSAR